MVQYETLVQGYDNRGRSVQSRRLSFYLVAESHLASLRRRLPRGSKVPLSWVRPSQLADCHVGTLYSLLTGALAGGSFRLSF